MTIIPTLETARFRLRAPERHDFDAYAAMWADARVTQYIGGTPRDRTTSWGKYCSMAGMWRLMGYGHWVFADRDNDRFIGGGGMFWLDRGVPQLEGYPEAGWSIAPDWWGKGAASEIMRAALTWADATLASEIRCIINPGNDASERVAAKLGFDRIGGHLMGPDDPVNVYARPVGGVTPP